MLKYWFAAVCCALSLSALALDVNTANEAELDSVRGLGPSSTARVLKAREQGPFRDWADLMQRVKGIKASSATKLSAAGLTVNQQPFPAPTDTSAPLPATAPVAGAKVP